MPEDINLQLPPALEAFGADFARAVQLANDQPARHPNQLRRDRRGVRRWLGRGRGPAWRRLGVTGVPRGQRDGSSERRSRCSAAHTGSLERYQNPRSRPRARQWRACLCAYPPGCVTRSR